nr:zinc ABC transporter substrate-binding protein [Salipaludibacillus neizhouensis]
MDITVLIIGWIEAEVENLPEDKRTIIMSENAFKYFGEAYGLQTEGIWEINSHEEGTTGQINRVIDIIQDENVPAVFVETTVDQIYGNSSRERWSRNCRGGIYGCSGRRRFQCGNIPRYDAP